MSKFVVSVLLLALANSILALPLSGPSDSDLLARSPLPAPAVVVARKPLRRRSTGRCAPNSSSSSLFLAPTPSSSSSPPPPVVEPEAPPSSSSSSSSSSPHPPPTSSSQPPPPPPPPTSSTTPPAPPTPSPSPTPAPAPAPAPSPSPAPPPSSGTNSGQGTYYAPGLGACGVTNSASDFIVAVSHDLFDTFPGYNGVNPNSNPVCGKQITAHYQGKSVTVTVEDRCVGCAEDDLDFSPAAFDQLADESLGRIGITWGFN